MKKIMGLIFVLALTGCSSGSKKGPDDPNLAVTNASVAPAAQGRVTTAVDPNGNTQVNVQVKHLARPDIISPGANGYIVWVKPVGESKYQNVGAMIVNENLEGKYQTRVPYKHFNLIVTPESSMTAQTPSGVVVLEKNVNL